MAVRDYHDLQVYRSAIEGSRLIFRMTRCWPAEERFDLISQVRRSSRSVPATLAEAWFKRPYPAAFVNKLRDALAEAAETITWIEQAADCGYGDPEGFARLRSRYRIICAQLMTMIKQRHLWCREEGDGKS